MFLYSVITDYGFVPAMFCKTLEIKFLFVVKYLSMPLKNEAGLSILNF